MCRVYESKDGPRTRLCYRTGRRGVMVPGRLVGPNGHAQVGRPRRRREASTPRSRRVCTGCGSPALSRHARLCLPCQREAMRPTDNREGGT